MGDVCSVGCAVCSVFFCSLRAPHHQRQPVENSNHNHNYNNNNNHNNIHNLHKTQGRDVYVDIAGWHLFLRDMSAVPGLKMANALAAQLGPQAASAGRGGLREADVSGVLRRIPVDVGGGRVTVRARAALWAAWAFWGGSFCWLLAAFAAV